MKKRIALPLRLLLCLSLPAALAEEGETRKRETSVSGDYEYVVPEDGRAEIVKPNGTAATLDVSGELDGKPVTWIGGTGRFFTNPA